MLKDEDYMKIFHEIKNSVTIINSYMQLIAKKHPEIVDFDYWTNSQTEITRLRSIVTELSQAKLVNKLPVERLDLKPLLAECCDTFRCFNGEEGITSELILPEEPCIVTVDPKSFRHAISNLLKNACEAMNHHGNIHVMLAQTDSHAIITIQDYGYGIPSDIIEDIFNPFVTTKEDGSGLGLNITQQIILAHKGIISVESQVGVGSTFTIQLPLNSAKN